MLTKRNITLLLLLSNLVSLAQTNYNVKLGRDNVPLTQVKLSYNGSTITQNAGHSVSTQTSLPVDLLEVTINDGGTSKTLDQLNLYGSAIRNNNFSSNVSGVGVYNQGTITSANNAVAFEGAMGEVASGANLLAYLFYDGTSNLPSGDDFDMFWSYGLDNDDYLVVAERDGNTYFTVTPLDSMGNPITSARKLRFGQTNGTNSSNGNRKYDWNIGYRPTNQNQPMYMTVVDVSLFNSSVSIHGIRIDNNGQADVKFFGVSDDPFTDNPTTTVIGSITGNVYRDADGTIDNQVDGTGLSIAGTTQLYVSAVGSAGAVVKTVEVDADGTYEILNLPSDTYSVLVHTTLAGSATAAVPSGWYHTGENLGSGIGHDGAINGTLASIVVTDTLVRFANFGLFTSPLSVKWKEVSVQDAEQLGHKVQWTTATEEDSDYFEIERSVNGQPFEYIGYEVAAGNSNEETSYLFIDTDGALLQSADIAYRIKEIGVNGKASYSDIVYLDKKIGTEIAVYPNPVRERATITFGTHTLNRENTQLTDATGTDMSFALQYDLDRGVAVESKGLSKGVYFLIVNLRGELKVKRILVQN